VTLYSQATEVAVVPMYSVFLWQSGAAVPSEGMHSDIRAKGRPCSMEKAPCRGEGARAELKEHRAEWREHYAE